MCIFFFCNLSVQNVQIIWWTAQCTELLWPDSLADIHAGSCYENHANNTANSTAYSWADSDTKAIPASMLTAVPTAMSAVVPEPCCKQPTYNYATQRCLHKCWLVCQNLCWQLCRPPCRQLWGRTAYHANNEVHQLMVERWEPMANTHYQ